MEHKDEIAALELARAIGIRAPRMRRFVPFIDVMPQRGYGSHFLVMERVHGLTLEQLWPTLGLWRTLRLAWKLGAFLRTMRGITSPTMGGLSTGVTTSEWFQDEYGPARHASPAVFSGYLTWWLTECQPHWHKPRPELILQPHENHFQFVHQDLVPLNMIMDDRGKLWIVDWGHAGYYPAYMEYLGIETTAMPWIYARTWGAWYARLRWAVFRWIAAGPGGPHAKACKALGIVENRSCRYKLTKTPYSYVSRYDKTE